LIDMVSNTCGSEACYYRIRYDPYLKKRAPTATKYWDVLRTTTQYDNQQPNFLR